MNMAPTLVTACTALDVPMPEATALQPVPPCAGRTGAAGLSPKGANLPRGGPSEDCSSRVDELLDERGLSKLRWRCRRGLLENDLFIERFFNRFADTLTVQQANALGLLMDLSDNDLLDVHMGRKSLAEVSAPLDREDVHEVLSMLRKTVERSKNETS